MPSGETSQQLDKYIQFSDNELSILTSLLVFSADWLLDLRSPTGEVLNIAIDATFQGGRIRSLNEVKFVFIKLHIY